MFKRLFKSSESSKNEILLYGSIITDRNNRNNAKRGLYVLSLGVIMELVLIAAYDIPNIIENGLTKEHGIYYLICHSLLFLISLIGTFEAYRFLHNKKFILIRVMKFETFYVLLALAFLSGIAVITGLDQVYNDSITIYVFFALISGFFFTMKPKQMIFVLSIPTVLFIVSLIIFQKEPGILAANITNGILSIIVAFFISMVIYNNFVTFTITTIKLEESTKKLEVLSITDELTQIYNRRKLEHNSRKEISRSKRMNTPFSIIMFDIDHFKQVNDKYGHRVGDRILISLAQNINTQIRLEDTFARYGGEEFVIILSNSTLDKATLKAQTIQKKLKEVIFDQDITITLSFGVTQFIPGESSEDILERADKAMYEAKQAGRDRIVSK